MSSDAGDHQRRYREFLDLMPLTIALAGLPHSEVGKYFSQEQMEDRFHSASCVPSGASSRSRSRCQSQSRDRNLKHGV